MNRNGRSEVPDWMLPRGVTRALWRYAHEPSIARDYDSFFRDYGLFDLDRAWLDRHFRQPGRLVDLGCGTGRLLLHFAARGFWTLGVDLSEEMLHVAGAKAAGDGVRIERVRANLCRLGCLADCSFDYAICMFSTLGMVAGAANRRQVVEHVRRVLRPGGLFGFHVHNRWYNLHDPQGRRWLVRNLISSSVGWTEPGDKVMEYRGIPQMYLHIFTRRELKALLGSCGLRVREVLPLGADWSGRVPAAGLLSGLRATGYFALAERV